MSLRVGGMDMDWSSIAAVRVNDLTGTRSAGRPVNTHVTLKRETQKPDFERMQRLVHPKGDDRLSRVPSREANEN